MIYDPLFTSLFGGTIGHMANGLTVRRVKNETKKIALPLAFVRFIIKALLGWISLLTMSSNKKNQALHDLAIDSVVIYKE
ncbi:MAG: RDD family protein [Flavobacteriales bacterium]|nr:RDD family protein [Flavobacteriales bacterium]